MMISNSIFNYNFINLEQNTFCLEKKAGGKMANIFYCFLQNTIFLFQRLFWMTRQVKQQKKTKKYIFRVEKRRKKGEKFRKKTKQNELKEE